MALILKLNENQTVQYNKALFLSLLFTFSVFPLNLQITKVKIEQIEPPQQEDFTFTSTILHEQRDGESSLRQKNSTALGIQRIEIPSKGSVSEQ